MDDSVTVITLTRGRVGLLKRAIASVRRQDYSGRLSHLIVVDACERTRDFLSDGPHPGIVWYWLPRGAREPLGAARVAKLRNHAVRKSASTWLAFLDDDNEFEPMHLSSLVSLAKQTGCRAVHSHLKLYRRDGTPYLEAKLPWCRDGDAARAAYEKLRRQGVFQAGSNIVRDRADALTHPDPVRTVDTGEWLLERSLLLEYPFCERYSDEDVVNVTTEDDKLLQTLIREGVRIACTGIPSLRYYLGGYSNNFAEQ